MRSGLIGLDGSSGASRYAGAYGYGWSSHTEVITYAYYLKFATGGTSPSDGPYFRWVGNPLRCLSTVLDI